MLDRRDAWDTLPNVNLGADGSFVFEGVPAESVGLSVNVPGFEARRKEMESFFSCAHICRIIVRPGEQSGRCIPTR